MQTGNSLDLSLRLKPAKLSADYRQYQFGTSEKAVCNFFGSIIVTGFYRAFFSEIWRVIAWSNFCRRQGVPLFNALVGGGVNLEIWDADIWPQETINIPISYGVNGILMLKHLGVTHQYERQTDRRTDRLFYSNGRTSLRCAAENDKLSVLLTNIFDSFL